MNHTLEDFEITQECIQKEAELQCNSLHLLQDTKENSIIEAKQLLIDGATDSYSSQFAHTAKINLHKGKLRCHKADIDTLDGGEVHATEVSIKNALSGHIYAQDVTIDFAGEDVTVIASNSITVHNVPSTNNTFLIDYTQVPILLSKLELIENDIKQLTKELDDAKRHNHSIVPSLEAKIILLEKDKFAIVNSSKTATIQLNTTTNI